MTIFDRLLAILKTKKEGDFTLNIGTVKHALFPYKKYKYTWMSTGVRVEEYNSYKWRRGLGSFKLRPELEPNPHIIIVGMSGYGKSTLLRGMINDITNGKKAAIVFDAHNEHEDAVRAANGKVFNAAYSGINIFDLSGASIAERIGQLTTLFKSTYALGYIQTMKLGECLWYTYRKLGATDKNNKTLEKTPTIKDLVAELNIFIKNSRTTGERNTLLHLKGRLSLLNTVTFARNFVPVDSLKEGLSSFSLAGLGNGEAQLIYIHEVLRRLYISMKKNEKERGLRLYVVLDEAQFLINSSESEAMIIRKLIEEGRKYGVGVIIVTHMANRLEKQIVANASTFITFHAREPSEINYVSALLYGNNQHAGEIIKERLRSLKQYQALVVSSRTRNPTVVDTRNVKKAFAYQTGSGSGLRRREVPPDVKMFVWERDSEMCVKCGSKEDLHFDHIIPYSLGGSSKAAENIQLLCAKHNLEKHDTIQ